MKDECQKSGKETIQFKWSKNNDGLGQAKMSSLGTNHAEGSISVIKEFTYINFSLITFVLYWLTCIILYSEFKLLLNESYSDLLKHTMAYSPTSIVVIT